MLTVREFSTAANRPRRWLVWFLRGYSVLLLFLVLNTVLFGLDRDEATWRAMSWGLIGVSFSVIVVVGIAVNLLARRDPRLLCPHCKRGLFRLQFRVVATRACPRCQRVILTDPEPQKPVPLTRAQADENRAKFWRENRRSLIGFPTIWLSVIGLIFGSMWLKDAGWIGESVAICVACSAAAFMLGWLVWSAIRSMRSLSQMIRCPRCGAKQDPIGLAKFGHCTRCSQPLVAEPEIAGVVAESAAG
jgi:Zn-finger nucleic acid-binding protein